jgi:hypothetical protein
VANYIQEGNFTETWSVPFSCVAMFVLLKIFTNANNMKWPWLVVCGSTFAAVFLMRPNNAFLWIVGIPILIVDQLRRKHYRRLFAQLLWLSAGAVLAFAPTLLWLALNGALYAWFRATIWLHLRRDNPNLIDVILTGVKLLQQAHVKYLIIILFSAAFYAGICVVFKNTHRKQPVAVSLFFLFGLVFGFILCMMTGDPWLHYLFTLFPIFAFAGAFFAELIFCCFERMHFYRNELLPIFVVGVFLFVVLGGSYGAMMQGAAKHDRYFPDGKISMLAAGNYIESNSDPEDKFMVYGYAASFVVNTSNRYVATFIHTQPFFFDDAYFGSQYRDLLYNGRPRYFLATQEPSGDILNYLTEHYRIVREDETFKLYEYINPDN